MFIILGYVAVADPEGAESAMDPFGGLNRNDEIARNVLG